LNRKITIQKIFPKVLHQYIEAFKIYNFTDDEDVQLLPKGVFEIVFQNEHSFQHNTNYSSGWKLRPRNFVGGLHSQSYTVNSGKGKNYCIVVEFKPNTAKYFIPERLNAFQNSVVDINVIWGSSSVDLSRKIDREHRVELKVDHIESFLLRQFTSPKGSVIDVALNKILSSQGFVRINELSQSVLLSEAQFRKRFNEEVGMSPIQYSRIVRVNSALELMKSTAKSMTDISYSLGYFDQSHFIKDFKNIVGVSPKKFHSQLI